MQGQADPAVVVLDVDNCKQHSKREQMGVRNERDVEQATNSTRHQGTDQPENAEEDRRSSQCEHSRTSSMSPRR